MPAAENYLMFDGNCAGAMRHYERVLGGKLEVMTYGDSPVAGEMPPGNETRVMHAMLAFDGGVLMASDTTAGMQYDGMKGFFVSLYYPGDVGAARRVYDELRDGGHLIMELQKTFWAEAFAMFSDRYGTPWMVRA